MNLEWTYKDKIETAKKTESWKKVHEFKKTKKQWLTFQLPNFEEKIILLNNLPLQERG